MNSAETGTQMTDMPYNHVSDACDIEGPGLFGEKEIHHYRKIETNYYIVHFTGNNSMKYRLFVVTGMQVSATVAWRHSRTAGAAVEIGRKTC